MRRKSKRGGTLLIVISGILVMVLLGYSLILLCQILSVSRQTVSSIDMAALSVAREASYNPAVNVNDIGTPEFRGLGDKGSDQISLATYNKAVAKTIMVALNAEDFGNAASLEQAKHMKVQLDKLRDALEKKLENNEKLIAAFDKAVGANFIKMAEKGTLERVGGLEWSCVGEGDPSGIFFDPNSLSAKQKKIIEPYLQADGPKSSTGQSYLKGYSPITIAGITIEALPIRSGQQPHLVSQKDFANGKGKHPNALPTAVMLKSRGGMAAMLQQSAAMIGYLQTTTAMAAAKTRNTWVNFSRRDSKQIEEAANIQDGYIKFSNLPAAKLSSGVAELVSDGDNDLFNKELFSPSRIVQANNGVFTTDAAQMDAWIAYNKGAGTNPEDKFNLSRMRSGNGMDQQATKAELAGIRSLECECTHTMYTKELKGPCIAKDNLRKWSDNYRRFSIASSTGVENLSAFEVAKYEVLARRINFSKAFGSPEFNTNNHTSGMKIFQENKVYSCPPCPIDFSRTGTIMELLDQIASRSTNYNQEGGAYVADINNSIKLERDELFDHIYEMACDIDPFLSRQELQSMLSKCKLPLGKSFILYKKDDKLVLEERPVGKEPTWPVMCAVGAAKIPVSGFIVNSPGDARFADAPFSWTTEGGGMVTKEGWTQYYDPVTGELVEGMIPYEEWESWMIDASKMMFGWENVNLQKNPGGSMTDPVGTCLGEVRFACGTTCTNLSCPN